MTTGYRTYGICQRPIGHVAAHEYRNPDGLDCYQTSHYAPPVTEAAAELIIRLGITRQDVKALELYIRIAQYPDQYRAVMRSTPRTPLAGDALIAWVAEHMGWSREFIVKCLDVITYLP